ncbi:MAG: Hint domain-containing protein [Paracoccaceae bacterium]|jgi:hypothetical protein|nr:Hint domain-containing protein [Paracoccaceae bacterium]
MGFNIFNIEDTLGNNSGGGPDGWIYEIDLWDHVDEVSGDFDVINLNNGNNLGEAADGYTYSALNDDTYGYISTNTATGEWTFYMDRDAVLLDASNQTITFTIEGFDDGDSDDDSITINILICLCRGTLIDTPCGPVAVEDLHIDDLVTTADGDAAPLRWMGSRKISKAELKLQPDLHPIKIRKGALDDGVPSRDLWVSPNHNILIRDWRAQLLFSEDEVLVPAKALIDDGAITRDTTVSGTEYFHLLFDSHQIILTEGAPTESFFPGPFSLKMLSPDARYNLLLKFPSLGDEGGYGTAARPCLTPWEGQFLRRDEHDSDAERRRRIAA